ncbi:hypothetical protein LCGC14_2789970 [marine sediment metagenome]|uniref:Uncharacterized protein n=1 Tax=marine sediment metagenome TaxID=412755 RepID=A0A0F8YQR3_9ZZZZ
MGVKKWLKEYPPVGMFLNKILIILWCSFVGTASLLAYTNGKTWYFWLMIIFYSIGGMAIIWTIISMIRYYVWYKEFGW